MLEVKTAFSVLLMVSLLGIAACGDDDGDEGGTTTGAEEAGTAAGGDENETSANESGEPILIKTHLAPLNAEGESTGEVLSGSTIGDSAFCAGGKFLDSACAGAEPVGAEVVPLPRWHPDDHLHLDTTWRETTQRLEGRERASAALRDSAVGAG